jgi:hypothetical protein
MSGSDHQIPYVVERALESAADAGLRPARVYWAAFPLYITAVSATVVAREPFDLLDRYVSLAMSECRFGSVSQIAEYLGVTEHIVERVRRFLTEIGHVTGGDGALALTDLGLRAARDDTRYTPKEDRLKLYFDGVSCAPLPSKFYGRGVRVMSRGDALAQRKFRLLEHGPGFSAQALAQLASRRDRADYNLPDEHLNLALRDVEQGFLPCYLIRARTGSGFRTLVYTAADSSASDAYLEGILQGWPAIVQALCLEDSAETDRRDELDKWLAERGLSFRDLTWASHDVPQLRLPARHFPLDGTPVKAKGQFPLHQVGSYVTQGNYILHLWCSDPATRREASLARALAYADAGRRDEEDVVRFLEQISRRLQVEPTLDTRDLREYARRTGRGALSL